MDLASYADLAVRLVNSGQGHRDGTDPLASASAFGEFAAGEPLLAGVVTVHDLSQLRALRADLASVFTAIAEGSEQRAIDLLNSLMMIYPAHPVLLRHGDGRWHLHTSESGSVSDRYGGAAAAALAMLIATHGTARLGLCAIASCDRVFINSAARPHRYCATHGASRANVAALPTDHGAGTRQAGLSRPAHATANI